MEPLRSGQKERKVFNHNENIMPQVSDFRSDESADQLPGNIYFGHNSKQGHVGLDHDNSSMYAFAGGVEACKPFSCVCYSCVDESTLSCDRPLAKEDVGEKTEEVAKISKKRNRLTKRSPHAKRSTQLSVQSRSLCVLTLLILLVRFVQV